MFNIHNCLKIINENRKLYFTSKKEVILGSVYPCKKQYKFRKPVNEYDSTHETMPLIEPTRGIFIQHGYAYNKKQISNYYTFIEEVYKDQIDLNFLLNPIIFNKDIMEYLLNKNIPYYFCSIDHIDCLKEYSLSELSIV